MSRRPSFADYEPTVERLLGRGIGNDEFAYPWEFDEEGVALCVLQQDGKRTDRLIYLGNEYASKFMKFHGVRA